MQLSLSISLNNCSTLLRSWVNTFNRWGYLIDFKHTSTCTNDAARLKERRSVKCMFIFGVRMKIFVIDCKFMLRWHKHRNLFLCTSIGENQISVRVCLHRPKINKLILKRLKTTEKMMIIIHYDGKNILLFCYRRGTEKQLENRRYSRRMFKMCFLTWTWNQGQVTC